jgi:hypothetical protein
MGHLWDALCRGFDRLGLPTATGEDEAFRQLVLARIIEPASKQDSLRVLQEAGIDPASYPTVNRRLPVYARAEWRQRVAAACAAHARLGPASLVLYDVSTLYFETDTGDGFRESGLSKERRLEPQITIGLLTDAAGFPLMVEAFEGSGVPSTPGGTSATGRSSSSRGRPARPTSGGTRSSTTSTRRIGLGAPGAASTSRSPRPKGRCRDNGRQAQSVRSGARRHPQREPDAGGQGAGPGRAEGIRHQPGHLSGWHPGHRRLRDRRLPSAFPDRKSFRMSKHDFRARPIYHHKRDSIEAHLTIVLAALAGSRWIEQRTGWSIKKFVRTARRYRTVTIRVGARTLTAADPLPDDLRHALKTIHANSTAH